MLKTIGNIILVDKKIDMNIAYLRFKISCVLPFWMFMTLHGYPIVAYKRTPILNNSGNQMMS